MKITRLVPLSIALFTLSLLGSLPAFAQVDAGAIRGIVRDSSGAVVSGAKVTVRNELTGVEVSTTTAQDGSYTFAPIKIGTYAIEVTAAGFRKATQSHVEVKVQQQVAADITLTPGAVTETVEVTEVAPLLQTQDASVGTVATREQINDLPLAGRNRNYTFLAQIAPGVTSQRPTRGLEQTGGFVANGLAPMHNNYLLDGIDNNNDTVDYLNGASYVNLPPPDAIQEFKVQTSNFSAELGRAGGAVVNATVRSGTNNFHVTGWEFLRNDILNASQEFFVINKVKKGELRNNQFGFAVGGPIFKGKTFFFGDLDIGRIREGALKRPDVPTLAQRQSRYTDYRDVFSNSSGTATDVLGRVFPVATIFDPATTRSVVANGADPVTGILCNPAPSPAGNSCNGGFVRDPFYTGGSIAGITDFTGRTQFLNQLPAARLDPNAIKLLDLYPDANQPGIVSNFAANFSQPDDSNHFDVRIDHNFSDRDQMFGRVSRSNRNAFIPGDFTGLGSDTGFGAGNFHDNSWNVAFSETHSFSPTMINEARFGYGRLRTTSETPYASTPGIPDQFGIAGIPQVTGNGGLPGIGIDGLTGLGAGGFATPNRRESDTYQFTENLTKVHATHTFKGGFEYQSLHFPWLNPAWSRGQFNFGGYTGVPSCSRLNNQACGGSKNVGQADILLLPQAATVNNGVGFVGGPNTVFSSNITKPDDFRHYYGMYFQDDWRTTPKLTVNLGMRWELFGPISEAHGRQGGMLPGDIHGLGAQYVIPKSQRNAPLSASFLNILAKDKIQLAYVGDNSIETMPLTNFAPRIGLAYRTTSKLVTRAGYGIFYSGFENLGGSPDPGYDYPFAVNLGFFRSDDHSPLVYPNGQRATLEGGLTAANPDPTGPNFDANGLGLNFFQRPWQTGYVQQWNAAVEYELTDSQTITLSYVGHNSHHLMNGDARNVPTVLLPPGTDPKPYVPFPDLSRNRDYIATNGANYYHAFQAGFERRFQKGLNLLVNYTRSVCRHDVRDLLQIRDYLFVRAPVFPPGVKREYRWCGDDTPNVFHASGIWELPLGKGKRFGAKLPTALDEIIGGWSAQWLLTSESGFPISVKCPIATTASQGPGAGCYANTVPGKDLYLRTGHRGIDQFLSPAAFVNPPVATTIGQTDLSPLGGVPTQAHGPAYNDLDFSVFKRFRTSENSRLEFRSEFYNFLNHPNFCGDPTGCFKTLDFRDTANFARINQFRGNARQVQLGLKFYW